MGSFLGSVRHDPIVREMHRGEAESSAEAGLSQAIAVRSKTAMRENAFEAKLAFDLFV